MPLLSVLWRCWLGRRKGIQPVKTEWWGAGMVVCLQRVCVCVRACVSVNVRHIDADMRGVNTYVCNLLSSRCLSVTNFVKLHLHPSRDFVRDPDFSVHELVYLLPSGFQSQVIWTGRFQLLVKIFLLGRFTMQSIRCGLFLGWASGRARGL